MSRVVRAFQLSESKTGSDLYLWIWDLDIGLGLGLANYFKTKFFYGHLGGFKYLSMFLWAPFFLRLCNLLSPKSGATDPRR